MVEKFTRLGAEEGDILYATTVASSISIESLENNIDTAMVAFIGQDTSGSIGTSTTETVIAQVTVAANTVASNLIIMAGYKFQANAQSQTGTFKLRIGTAGTTSDAQVGEDVVLLGADFNNQFASTGSAYFKVALAGTDFDKTVLNYISITGTNSASSGNTVCTCTSLVVLGA